TTTTASSGRGPSSRRGRERSPPASATRCASCPSARRMRSSALRLRWESSAVVDAKTLTIPELSLVVMIGASGSGKSSFARKHFKTTEIISSDFCRGLVSDDETSLDASKDAFEVLNFIAGKRLARGLLTVVDATNVQREARAPLVALAREYHCVPVA